MDWTYRTLLRIFLLLGGIVFVVQGVLDDAIFDLLLGIAATLLGATGLWWEWNQA